MLRSLLAVVLSISALIALVAPSFASASASKPETRYRASLGPAGRASGHADYRDRDGVRRFSAEIEDAAPNKTYRVVHNGKTLGYMTTNRFGFADFNLKSQTDDPGQQGFVPVMRRGDKILVGPLSGNLR